MTAVVLQSAVDFLTASGAANLKSEGIIKISNNYNPEIEMHDGISIISFKLRFDGGRR